MTSLQKLRDDLKSINLELFKILKKRKELVILIQKEKKTNNHYDKERELALFRDLKNELLTFDERELLAFSLIMESHAKCGDENSYPSFFDLNPSEFINPNLLEVLKED